MVLGLMDGGSNQVPAGILTTRTGICLQVDCVIGDEVVVLFHTVRLTDEGDADVYTPVTHKGLLVGRAPGCSRTAGAFSFPDTHILHHLTIIVNSFILLTGK
jgi:hypothetical protein